MASVVIGVETNRTIPQPARFLPFRGCVLTPSPAGDFVGILAMDNKTLDRVAEALEAMASYDENGDQIGNRDFESDHIRADELLLDALRCLGQERIVKAFRRVGTWYA